MEQRQEDDDRRLAERTLTVERDMARRIGNLSHELPHTRQAFKDIIQLITSLEKLFKEVKSAAEYCVAVSESVVRSHDEIISSLRSSAIDVLRLKTEFSHIRNRSKDFVQALINLEQVCVDTHGSIIDLLQSSM